MDYAKRFRVSRGFSLEKRDPDDTADVRDKARARALLDRGIVRLADGQERLYAQNTWSLLVIFQAMDAAGKDSTIKHVMSGVNPQGVQVYSFKAPSAEELDHDYLWRSVKALPERGRIGIHNRSYYEEVLVVRVHPQILAGEQLPSETVDKRIWLRRYREINRFERYLTDNGTRVLKFFLHVSKDEQRKRFLKRLEEPEKYWKFQPGDVKERAHWDDYMDAYEEALRHTSTKWAPWYVVPADHKWFTRLAVADIIVRTLDDLRVRFPSVSASVRAEFAKLKKDLGGSTDEKS